MQYFKHHTIAIFAIALLVVTAFALQTEATRRSSVSTPAVLVSVDLERVFSSLEERVYEQSKAQEVINAITESIEKRRQRIENYEQEFELYEPGSAKWEELMQEQQLEVLEYQAAVEYRNLKAAREESKGMRRVYENIRSAVTVLAKENGWDYVFVNDAAVAFPEGDIVDLGVQISNRRMLYANSTMDVTDTIIEYMNASFDEMAVR